MRSTRLLAPLLMTAAFTAASPASAALVINMDGIRSNHMVDNPANTILAYDVGANARVSSLAFDVVLTALGMNVWSDSRMAIYNSTGDAILYAWDPNVGLHGRRRYNRQFNLEDIEAAMTVGADGRLFLQFYQFGWESPKDGVTDTYYNGTITFAGLNGTLLPGVRAPVPLNGLPFNPNAAPTPEPATWLSMVLGVGLIGTGLRRRRTTVSWAA